MLSKRSVIQFLMEDFGNFPARNLTLCEELNKANICDSIEILDEIIRIFRGAIEYDDVPTDPEEAGSLEMPGTHIWWSYVTEGYIRPIVREYSF